MQALSDDQQLERLEKKMDDGFAEMRAEFKASRAETQEMGRELRAEIISARSDARQDFRTLLSVTVGMWVTTALAVVEILLGHG